MAEDNDSGLSAMGVTGCDCLERSCANMNIVGSTSAALALSEIDFNKVVGSSMGVAKGWCSFGLTVSTETVVLVELNDSEGEEMPEMTD